MTIDEFIQDATQRMDKSVEATHEHFNSVRTGRATPALLDRITIDYYGTPTPLKNLATINAPRCRTLRPCRREARHVFVSFNERAMKLTLPSFTATRNATSLLPAF